MPDELRLAGAFALALALALIATPAAIRLARRTRFYDHPAGYKRHSRPTPYLGGLAVVFAFVLAGLAFGGGADLAPILGGACALLVVGTLDDRIALGPWPRLAAEALVASALWALDLGWAVFDSELANLLLTNLWVVGVVNAFNLMDNLDGAAPTVASVSAAGVGAYALIEGDVSIAVLMLALIGACLGFLRYNLAGPARIFLGDGGSMPLGFAVAAGIMAVRPEGGASVAAALAALALVGLPALDTTLVTVSRVRRGVAFWDGGRDHLTHRLLGRLSSPREVALALATVQAGLCAIGVAALQLHQDTMLAAGLAGVLIGITAVVVIEAPIWTPERQQR